MSLMRLRRLCRNDRKSVESEVLGRRLVRNGPGDYLALAARLLLLLQKLRRRLVAALRHLASAGLLDLLAATGFLSLGPLGALGLAVTHRTADHEGEGRRRLKCQRQRQERDQSGSLCALHCSEQLLHVIREFLPYLSPGPKTLLPP